MKFLLKYIFNKYNTSNECLEFTTEEGGNILHFTTQYSRNCLAELIPHLSHLINKRDNNGKYAMFDFTFSSVMFCFKSQFL